jgi:hypothetical protein
MYILTDIGAGVALGLAFVAVRTDNSDWLMPGMIFFSPVVMLVARVMCEDWFDRSFFNPRVMSFGFIVGDTVLLPIALFMAGTGWQDLPSTGWHRSEWFALNCIAIGVLSSELFCRFIDGPRYVQADVASKPISPSSWWHDRAEVASALISPTKWWHDRAVMTVVTTMFAWLLIPLWVIGGSDFTRPAFVFLALFGGTLIIDTIIKPDPARQHPKWDPVRFDVA